MISQCINNLLYFYITVPKFNDEVAAMDSIIPILKFTTINMHISKNK